MEPPFSITPEIMTSVSRIERFIGRIEGFEITATASRDLKLAVDSSLLTKTGEKALTIYRYQYKHASSAFDCLFD